MSPRPDRKYRVALRRAALSVLLGAPAMGLVLVAQQQLQLIGLQREVATTRERAARNESVVEILGSQQLVIQSMSPATAQPGARAVLYLDASSGAGLLTVRRVSPRASGRALQLWFARGEKRVSGGLVWPDANGDGGGPISVPSDVDTFDFAILTDEPPAGSEAPTTSPVFDAPIKAANAAWP
jgi:hypothetical protein